MGVKNLWDILESCKKILPLHHLQNKRVCVDLSCWMVQLQNVNKSYCSMKDKLYLRGLFHRLRALIALNCSVVFVTDGSIPAIKISTYRKRLNLVSEATQDDTSLQKVTSLRRNKGSEFSCMVKEAKLLGAALGVTCLDGIEEAEAQCALLNAEKLCDACFSSDSDVFLFGARTVYRDICLGEGGYVVCYDMADIETKLGFGRNSLIALALFLGSDYSEGFHGVGPESACQIVKAIGDSAVLKKLAHEGLSIARKAKGSKKQGKPSDKENILDMKKNGNGNGGNNLQNENELLQVVNAFMKPKCHSADSDAVRRVLAQHPFQLSKLHQICTQFFDWPPEKTDEYILPKIAERDLRRFANLRSTSSSLGVDVPLYEMPVKCPVTDIIKQRKVQGEECFEVSWEGIDGLTSSIVPADLVRSACPEKIVEFEEKKVQGKKNKARKPRAKGLDKRVLDSEIDRKLQNLLLDIEPVSSTIPDASFYSKASVLENHVPVIDVDVINQVPRVDTDLESRNSVCNAAMPCQRSVPNEVIDLLSPSPPKGNKTISKYQPPNHLTSDIIELSDSETEVSPDHKRKATELRAFIASIRDDVV